MNANRLFPPSMSHHRPSARSSVWPGYLYWLIPLSAVVAVLLMTLLASGFRVLLYTRAPNTHSDWQAALGHEVDLRRDLALLQEQWLGRQALCARPAALPPVPTEAPGLLPEPPPPEPVAPPATPPPAPVPPDTPLVIPEQPDSMAFLEGCWRSVTDLFDTRDQKPIQHEYCFGEKGAGQVTVQSSSFVCKGKTRSVMQGAKKLVIKTVGESLPCNNQTRFSGWQVTCQARPDGKAVCQGVNYNDKTRFSVTLLRK